MKRPLLELIERDVEYETVNGNQKTLGFMAYDAARDERVAVTWASRFRKFDSYSVSCDLLHSLEDDVDAFLRVDKETGDVYRFTTDTYRNAQVVHWNNQDQYAPPRAENDGYWEDGQRLIAPFL